MIAARFGCRSFSFDPEKGFLLNGRSYPLRGVSRHQDFLGVGNAITLQEQTLDMELIREIGANTIRLAHYQHAQEFYDLCDEYGMIVWAEIPYITEHMPNGRQNTMDQMRELITQCYNHPSIVCWGLSNEVAVHGITEDLMQNHILLNDLCHEMDKTRPTTMAHPFMLEHESPLIQIPDIGSYNLYFGWYMGTLEQNDSFFDEYHEKYPKRIMGFSEYGADANVRFQTAHPEQGDYSEQYQCLYHESLLGTISRHPWMWATHLWNMFDFAADGRDEGGAHGLNQKGLVTFDRKIKKDAFYLYKATWNKEEPFVHICGRRYVDRTEQETEVRVYSNQHQVTLMMDGQKVDELEGETVFVFKLPISGRHTVKAVADSCQDEITVCKVDRPNKAYCLGKTGSVSNWFDEAEFKSDHYSIRDSFGVLMAHPQAGKLVGDLMRKIVESRGDVAKTAHKNPNLQKMLAGMSFQALLKQAGDSVSEATCKELNAALQKIPK
ncbi:MAG: glycoside hydrolase family 2 TIM barrel-domain containing protein [Eubacteriales bacterium]|nr:glycoside hydrolase family 2 TIM barrel-domain containing protein [Eubacteriales bacterium]